MPLRGKSPAAHDRKLLSLSPYLPPIKEEENRNGDL
jgi:hypothetical protein